LITKARIPIPQHVHEQLGTIDDNYVHRHCKPKRKATPAAPEHPTAPHEVPAIDPTLQNWFYHTWDQNAANYRAMTALHESMYRMQSQEQTMTPPEFQTFA
ncbi:hypothetical protein A2U01_0071802, partial [Trifolium medium]|nr:hypothetical protein [Trifolium medium]